MKQSITNTPDKIRMNARILKSNNQEANLQHNQVKKGSVQVADFGS